MGTNNSKENPDSTSPTNANNNIWRSSMKTKPAIVNKNIDYYGWQEICRCSHADWLHGISGMNISY
jgi:hypothetical protein